MTKIDTRRNRKLNKPIITEKRNQQTRVSVPSRQHRCCDGPSQSLGPGSSPQRTDSEPRTDPAAQFISRESGKDNTKKINSQTNVSYEFRRENPNGNVSAREAAVMKGSVPGSRSRLRTPRWRPHPRAKGKRVMVTDAEKAGSEIQAIRLLTRRARLKGPKQTGKTPTMLSPGVGSR